MKLTRAIPTSKKNATNIASLFVDHCIIPFGTSKNIYTDNGPQFRRKLFAFACDYPGIQHLTSTAYHQHTNGRAKLFNLTIVTRLVRLVPDQQRDRGFFAQSLKYTYNKQLHRATDTSPYSLVLTRQPPGPWLLSTTIDKKPRATDFHSTQAMQKLLQKRIFVLRAKVDANMRKSRSQHKLEYDRNVP